MLVFYVPPLCTFPRRKSLMKPELVRQGPLPSSGERQTDQPPVKMLWDFILQFIASFQAQVPSLNLALDRPKYKPTKSRACPTFEYPAWTTLK